MRLFLLLIASSILLHSCQKVFDPQEPLPQESKCRLIKMEYDYGPSIVVTHLFTYDAQKRIKYIVDTYLYDSTQPVYDGNTAKMTKAIQIWGSVLKRSFDYTYDNSNNITGIVGPWSKAEMMYKGNKLDSANLYMTGGIDNPDWEIFRYYKFGSNSSNSIVSYHSEVNGHGEDASFEYTNIRNPLKHLGPLNFKDYLRMTDIFPLHDFGYADEFLLKSYRIKAFYPDPFPFPDSYPAKQYEYKCDYDFDENENLVSSEVTIYADGVIEKVERRRYYYQCD
ncbi:MAG TPA: hypothetical protein VK616_01885 [Flavitalea sp.]|nr:hypothetical protein [Flavitalea sp.]